MHPTPCVRETLLSTSNCDLDNGFVFVSTSLKAGKSSKSFPKKLYFVTDLKEANKKTIISNLLLFEKQQKIIRLVHKPFGVFELGKELHQTSEILQYNPLR